MANKEQLYLIRTLSPWEDPMGPYYTGILGSGQQALLYKYNPYSLTYILCFRADGVLQDVQARDDINWDEDYPVIARWLEGIGFTPGPIRVREFSIGDPRGETLDAYLSGGYPRYYSELGAMGYGPDEVIRKHREWDERGDCILRLATYQETLEGAGTAE